MPFFDGFEKRRIEVGSETINCVVGGSGPPVLLLHGYPQNMAMWSRVAPLLADRFTVVCADLRGYGDSSKPRCAPDRSNYAFRAMAADQLGVMRTLGFERFAVAGHDRGGRTAHRLTLDNPEAVTALAVLDIAPTYAVFMETNRHIASSYWHWYFLSLPEPFPERLIAPDPNFFYETSMVGWGKARLEDFEPELMAEYRRCWNDPGMIHGSCSDYRAAASIDLEHDAADLDVKVTCPTLVFWGTNGLMYKLFDLEAEWRKRCSDVRTASLPGGHFLADQFPNETAGILAEFLGRTVA